MPAGETVCVCVCVGGGGGGGGGRGDNFFCIETEKWNAAIT